MMLFRFAAARGDSGWRLLTSEAHRTMFFFGALQAVLAVLWWAVDLGGRYAGLYTPIVWTVPPMWAHAWLLLYGLFPFFMFGFLMTAGPNWLGAPKTPRVTFVPAASMMASGVALSYAGLVLARPIAAAGVLLHALGWLWGLSALAHMLSRYWNPNARYALMIFGFLTLGLAGDAVFGLSIASASYAYAAPALHGAVWFFLLPVFIGVSTRMVPFFSSRVLGPDVDYRPAWARPFLIAGVLLHGVLELDGAETWLWVTDLPLACLVAYLTWRWGLTRTPRVRLVAVLHISLAVLAAAFAISAASSLLVAAGVAARIGLAPVHLITIGYFASMTLGMVSRVSLGHSGRPLEADALTWGCYLGVLAAAGVRAAAEIVPASAMPTVMMCAAVLWLLSFGVWASRYMPMYLMPRLDAGGNV